MIFQLYQHNSFSSRPVYKFQSSYLYYRGSTTIEKGAWILVSDVHDSKDITSATPSLSVVDQALQPEHITSSWELMMPTGNPDGVAYHAVDVAISCEDKVAEFE